MTGTIGAAHYEILTEEIIPSLCKRSSSSSTFFLSARGTVRALKNFGRISLFANNLTLAPCKQPNPLLKTEGMLL